MGFLAAFGGGILSALLLQDPKRAPIALLSSNAVGVTWTLCWWAVNYFPSNLVSRALALLPCRALAKVPWISTFIPPLARIQGFLCMHAWSAKDMCMHA